MGSKSLEISVIIPVYRSENSIGNLIDTIIDILKNYDLELILVDDCGGDNSSNIIKEKKYLYQNKIKVLTLSRNFGEHHAVMAGLNYSTKEFAVIIDDDFQNPPEEIINLHNFAVENKYDVVFGKYAQKKHSWFRNLGSQFNNIVAVLLLQKPKELYLCSFKIISKFTYREIIKYKGPFPYIDGLILNVTRNIGTLQVAHQFRVEGKSNYNLIKLFSLWSNMAFNFSAFPLRCIFFLGIIFSILGMILSILFVIEKLSNPERSIGWASIIVTILTFSGVQLIMLGLIGEYLGRVFLNQNKSPQFIVKEYLN